MTHDPPPASGPKGPFLASESSPDPGFPRLPTPSVLPPDPGFPLNSTPLRRCLATRSPAQNQESQHSQTQALGLKDPPAPNPFITPSLTWRSPVPPICHSILPPDYPRNSSSLLVRHNASPSHRPNYWQETQETTSRLSSIC